MIDLFVLSFEHGVQKPRPEMFQLALEGLNLPASQVLMVGDRAAYDGAAVGEGIATLLLPALRSVTDCRLQPTTGLSLLAPAAYPLGIAPQTTGEILIGCVLPPLNQPRLATLEHAELVPQYHDLEILRAVGLMPHREQVEDHGHQGCQR